jgi:hypothetical protein
MVINNTKLFILIFVVTTRPGNDDFPVKLAVKKMKVTMILTVIKSIGHGIIRRSGWPLKKIANTVCE